MSRCVAHRVPDSFLLTRCICALALFLLVPAGCRSDSPGAQPQGAGGDAAAPSSGGVGLAANTGGMTSGMAAGTGGSGQSTAGMDPATGGRVRDTGGAGTGGAGGTTTGGAGTGGATAGGAGTSGASAGGSGAGGSATGGAGGGVDGTAGATGGDTRDDLCDVGIYDPSNPPRNLGLSGSLGAHDPTMIEADGVFYRFQTGGAIGVFTSSDLTSWANAGTVWGNSVPSWTGTNDLWAPDIVYMGGLYHLYYSASGFGGNDSCIGHATRASLGSGSWDDRGSTICSSSGDNFNAIDPDVAFDENGTPWMNFGSFWSGVMQIELDLDGNRVGSDVENLARGPDRDGEGSFMVRRCGYYYLFMSWGLCCPGAAGRTVNDLTYNIRVGRSDSIHGPYVDRNGTPMLDGGGTLVVEGDGGATYYAAGHGEWILVGDTAYIIYHAYPGPGNQNELRIAELVWDDEGWPVQVGP